MKKSFLLSVIVLLFVTTVSAQNNGESLIRKKRNGKFGYVDKKGKEVIPCIYDSIGEFEGESHIVRVKKDGRWMFVDDKGNKVGYSYDYVFPFYGSNLALVCDKTYGGGYKFGYVDSSGTTAIYLKYKKAYPFSDGLAAVKVMDGSKFGFINIRGAEVISPTYSDVKWGFIEGFAWVKKGKKWGMINKTGGTKVDFQYSGFSKFDPETGYADAITSRGATHYYDAKGNKFYSVKTREDANEPKTKPVIEWQNVPPMTREQLFVLNAEVKSDSKIVFCKVYLNNSEVSEDNAPGGSVVVENTKKKDYYSISIKRTLTLKEGVNVIKIRVKNAGGEIEEQKTIEKQPEEKYEIKREIGDSGLAFVMKNGKCGYIDAFGNVVVPLKYDYETGETTDEQYVENWNYYTLVRVKQNGKYGMINRKGQEIIPVVYDEIYQNSIWGEDGFARVKQNGKYGMVNAKGKVVVPIKYEDLEGNFYNGHPAYAKLNGKYGYIREDGSALTAFKYDWADSFHFDGEMALVKNKEKNYPYVKFGYINLNGEEIIPLKYSDARPFYESILTPVRYNGKYGFINEKDEVVVDFIYEFADPFYNGLAGVVLNGKLGFIDIRGNLVIPFLYEYRIIGTYNDKGGIGDHMSPSDFNFGRALVLKNGKFGLIDNKGIALTDFVYDSWKSSSSGGNYKVLKNNKLVFLDKWGNEYDSAEQRSSASKKALYIEIEKGNAEAQYDKGKDSYGNEAYVWFLKSAQQGYPEAQWECGRWLENGYGGKKDLTEAIEWYKKAANQGHWEANRKLKELGVKYDKEVSHLASIQWHGIPVITDKSQFVLRAGIKSESKIEYCKVFLNNTEIDESNAPGGSAIVEDLKGNESHDIAINRILVLIEGKNTIGIKVKNAGGETVEEKTIEYKPEKSILEKVVIVWNALPSNVTESRLELDATVKSTVKDVTCQVLLNGEEVLRLTKGSSIVEDSNEPEYKYKVKVQRTLVLKENDTNTIVIEVKNAQGGLLKSDQKLVYCSKPLLATIEWGAMPSTTDEKQFNLSAQIKSDSEIENYSVTLNGIRTKGSYIVKDNHVISIDEVFNLREGDNIVKIVVKNKAGEVGEEKYITYTPKEKRIALVIGNADYKNIRFPKLSKTKEDARAMYALLGSYGFDMRPIVLDADLKKMREAINDFVDEVGRGGYEVALIYYSGHGLSPDGGANYLIPIDADIDYSDEVKHNAINSKTEMISRLEEKNCRVEIVLLDCCNDCALAERSTKGAYDGHMTPVNPKPFGISIIHAAQPGKKALEGEGKNSPFVESFIECTRNHPNVGWESFVNDFIIDVQLRTNNYQTPYPEGRIIGRPFYINPNPGK